MYRLLLIKRSIEGMFLFPFILLGNLLALLKPLPKEYKVFFFFPFYHTGGAEKVHSQIANATGGPDCIIYFTRRSADERFLADFISAGCMIRDISRFTDNKWLYFLNLIFRGKISAQMNRQKEIPVLFNGQSNFGYKISPWVKKSIPQIELIHSLNTFSYIRIPFLPFIKKTIMISRKRIDDHILLYKKYHIPPEFVDRIAFIANGIHFQQRTFNKGSQFTVLFVGRGSEEKRVHLFARVANCVNKINQSIRFKVIGDVSSYIRQNDFPYIEFSGPVNSQNQMELLYAESHVLMMPSSTEGFPMVVMEAMAHGMAILATPVGDIPYHVRNGDNGWLFSSISEEDIIVNEAVQRITQLYDDKALFHEISSYNMEYAKKNFSIDRFNDDYRKMFNQIKSNI